VETLGSTSVICTDKTGTLTRNEMVLRRAWTAQGDEAEFEGVGYAADGRVLVGGREFNASGGVDGPVRELLVAGVLANEAQLHTDGDERTAAERGGLALDELFRSRPPQAVLPFDSQRQYMASSPKSRDDGDGPVTYLKGAPEVLLAHVDPAVAGAAHAVLSRYAADGMRVLAVARRHGTAVDAALGDGELHLLGLVAMIDRHHRQNDHWGSRGDRGLDRS
jgi:magnesium-transporting ATPase (P-type)